MRPHHSTLSSRDVCALVVDRLTACLGWASPSRSVTPLLVIQLLVRAAAEMRSFFAVAQDATEVPSVETLRKGLLAMMPRSPEALTPSLTAALHHRIPKALAFRPRTMAIDLHLRPFYGDKATPGTIRGRREASTKTFFAYATLMVIRRGQTYTVGLVNVTKGQEQVEIIGRLLEQAAALGLVPRRLLLDRGFYAATTLAFLEGRGLPFVVPMIRRGRVDKGTGTTPFFGRDRQGWDTYTWATRPLRGGKRQASLSVTVAVAMVRRPGKDPLVFACQGMGKLAPEEVSRLYRARFRIETSYRQLGQGLVATCSKDPAFRLLVAGIALVLRNIWVWLHATLLIDRKRGRLRHHLLRLRRMMRWLMDCLDGVLGVRTEITIPSQEPVAA